MIAHIGGTTPLLPTTTRPDVSMPSPTRCAVAKTTAPGLRSSGVAGANATTGVARSFLKWLAHLSGLPATSAERTEAQLDVRFFKRT
ncbi:hypothetical protein EN742_13240 [Mesorhizobium sp. M4A.F.Ca.ET.020.02.1.1]|uniref:hypothetical protein n=1 Tax=unclassified Mesorhizobium TaxID=325217 RepID=UPI000FCA1442|nr:MULTISPECIES: hypothetical protein [unclassified Mesorhizobium]RUX45130.1 hypothetical protein EOA33_24935 [Mesorhizobium sp. M4A.F.Ca.ET.050.02.1.1]RVD40215.1 hypothetical protein EN742_13240 [Mesorhizobium sp. M4A.F.Ca.ET.020.02.1.1]RWC21683.1 MAG: hypothetical protein EOS53_04960 [Mesorhizobium sp.]RWD35058.1 MAG: hypothetical protein EOS33_08315 [Mesorhizobium sp.]TJW68957.1 MAG: hypothetical protein E5V29_09780 [Mesorhizobium sp.]